MGFDLSVGISAVTVFLQGLLSVFSPCVLPLIPLYIGYLAGGTAAVQPDGTIRYPRRRVLVNTPAALGGIGATTCLFPALTLGCGAVGGSSSSNNVSPLDLINIRRVAWGLEEPKCSARPAPPVNAELVELLAQKILERLG